MSDRNTASDDDGVARGGAAPELARAERSAKAELDDGRDGQGQEDLERAQGGRGDGELSRRLGLR